MRARTPGGPCPSDVGEPMMRARTEDWATHLDQPDHRLPHLQRRWATLRFPRIYLVASLPSIHGTEGMPVRSLPAEARRQALPTGPGSRLSP